MESRTERLFPALIQMPLRLLQEETAEKSYRGALLILRDCWEASFKFLGIALYGDLVGVVSPDRGAELTDLVLPLLRKPPAAGDWLRFYFACASLSFEAELVDNLSVPELPRLVYAPARKASGVRMTAAGRSLWDVVRWRNETIGHGALAHELSVVREMVLEQSRKLEEFLSRIEFVRALRVFSSGPAGSVIEWNRAQPPELETANTGSEVQPYFPVWMQRGDISRSLSPLLVMSMHERRSSLLTFDKISRGFFFLDYLLGTKVRFPHVAEIESIQEAVAGHEHLAVMEAFQHRGALAERERSYSGEALHALDRIEFGSDMEHWFVRQDYLLEALQRALREIPASIGAGYFHLVGPAGSGKSWFAHGLCDPHVFPLAPQVISYHVRIGLRQDPELFMEALCEQVRRPDGHNVRGARIRLEELDRPAAALAAFLADVLARSCQDGIILLLDGLDEVLEPPSAGELSIVDFLPDPDELPEGVVVVLTSRPDSECRPRARACLGRFAGVPTGYQRFDIHDHPQEQEGTLRHYLEARHHLKDAVMERVVHGCRGSFLVAKLLGRIYALSRQNDDIFFPSELQQVYSTYLGLIRHEVGEHLFDSLHRRLLSLVAVSPRALSLEEMADFLGLQEERLLFALFDAGEFFAVIRDEPANMFSVSHVEFSQYVLVNQADDAASRLREIVETFRAEEDVLGWLVDANALLAQSGHTQLSMFLSQLLLNLCPQSYAGRTTILSQYIDMVHITGNYRKAAELLADLATTLQEGEHLPPDHRSVVRAQLRRAHHLKFVADVATVRAILQPLMEHLAPDHPDRPEVEFMFYGSLGCLDDPGAAELEGLQMIAEGCRRREDLYLLTRCLRRIADLLLLLGRDDEALQAVDEAQEIAGASASRQAVYLNCTLAEIHRHRGELEAGIRCHRIGLELASQKGLMGWKGHAELGLAETWRMQGSRDMADAFLARAQLSYEAADHQGWGLIHVAISRALLHEDRPSLDRATREAARLGYRRDVEYGRRLLALALLPTTAHGAHFLLFP